MPAPKAVVSSSGPGTSSTSWLTKQPLHIAVLFLLSALLYANTLGHEFAQDDAIVITDNMFTTQGVKGISGILEYDTFYGFFKEAGKANLVAGGRYRPMSLILFAIEYQFFGKSPLVGHLGNILWYGFTVVLLYLLVLQFFRSKNDETKAYFIAFATAALFAAHPIHTEAVANIKGRDEILALAGSLGALYLSFRAYYENKWWMHIAAGLAFFAGLLAKENSITFVAVAPLSFYFFTNASVGKIVRQSVAFVIPAAIFLLIRGAVLEGASIGNTTMELMNNPFVKIVGNQYVPFTLGERLATVVYTLGKYLFLLFIPHPLTHDYYPRHIDMMTWGDWRVLLSLAAYIFVIVFVVRGLRKKDPFSFGLAFYLLTLSIVSNLVFPIGTNMAERLLFMPSVGWSFALAALAWQWVGKDTDKSGKIAASRLNMVWIAASLAVLVYGVRTLVRNPAWKNNYTLFTTDIHTSPNSAKLRNGIAGELLNSSAEKGDAAKQQAAGEAVGHLAEAIKIHPNYKNAYLLLGNAYNYLKDYEKSILYYQKALELDPDYPDAQNNLGITYREAGRFYGEQKGNLLKALEYLEKAYQLRPKEYETVRLLGVAYGISNNGRKAVEYFEKGIELQPNNADAWFDLGTAYMSVNNLRKGQEAVDMAESIKPGITEERKRKTQGQ